MKYICLLICTTLFIFYLRKDKVIYSCAIIMFGLWSVILFLNILNLFGINNASNETYIIIFCGMMAYWFGDTFGRYTGLRRIKLRGINRKKHLELNYKHFYILAVITIMLLLIDTSIAARYLLSGNSLNSVRMWLTESYGEGMNPIDARKSYFEQTFRVIVIEPFITAVGPICAIDFFGKKRGRHLLIITFIIIALQLISSGGGRLSLIMLVYTMLMAFMVYKKARGVYRNGLPGKGKNIRILSITAIIGIIILTLKRTSSGIIKEAYYYFAMCIPLFDYWLPIIKSYRKTFGMLGMFGILRIPFLALEKLGFSVPDTYINAQDYILQANKFHSVGSRSGNSFVSPFYYLYLDFGISGVILGMFLLGFIGVKLYRRLKVNHCDKDIYVYLLFLQAIFFTFIRWQFIATNYFMAFVLIPFLFKCNHKFS